MGDPHALAIEGVTKEFGDGLRVRVLHGVDLHVARGELVALMGPSGSGKSTLLHIAGLLDRPTAGRVQIAGTETTALDDVALTRFRGETLGFVFQFHHLLPAFTALENVMLPSWGTVGRPSRALRERAEGLLAEVGLAERSHHRPGELSGGQAQRVAIARALAHGPALVLADEPTGNLDTEASREVFALMRRQHRERGTAFLVVTHDARIADECDRVVRIVDGRMA
jgi:lipoprotein-releasing system ATP-binding protein